MHAAHVAYHTIFHWALCFCFAFVFWHGAVHIMPVLFLGRKMYFKNHVIHCQFMPVENHFPFIDCKMLKQKKNDQGESHSAVNLEFKFHLWYKASFILYCIWVADLSTTTQSNALHFELKSNAVSQCSNQYINGNSATATHCNANAVEYKITYLKTFPCQNKAV